MDSMKYGVVLILAVNIGILFGAWLKRRTGCPRNMLGYDCKGNDCDHSIAAVSEAESKRLPRHTSKGGKTE